MLTGLSIEDQIKQLETSLLQPAVRGLESNLANLIADDFVEFGGSGRTYNKRDVIAVLSNAQERLMELRDFQVRMLADDVVLTTFLLDEYDHRTQQGSSSLRSSIWKLSGGKWKIVFHQGTPVDSKKQMVNKGFSASLREI